MPLWGIILTVVAAIVLTVVITALLIREKDRRKLEYMLDAFEDGEYNFRFVDKGRFNRTLNRIKWVVDKRRQQNEEESWTKLIRVLTHEIMNTVSPIASLSDTLSSFVDDSREESRINLKEGLDTISSSSRNLIKFVESYRELAGVAKPVRKAVMVSDLVRNVIELTTGQCSSYGASCKFRELSEDAIIYADEAQISRILINLIKNALQAGASCIDISVEIEREELTLVRVSNNGSPVPAESREQIFIPFYTTKTDGSGIGLSLSRQVMLAHNGTIELSRSDEQCTEFTLLFR